MFPVFKNKIKVISQSILKWAVAHYKKKWAVAEQKRAEQKDTNNLNGPGQLFSSSST
jgi:hypothetical protein